MSRFALCLVLGWALLSSALAAQESGAGTEAPKVELLRPPSPHWVFLTDRSAYSETAGRIWIVDGDAQRMVGMLSSGSLPAFAIAFDGTGYFLGDTFWSRGARGVRSDFITYYDATSLLPTGETPLPNGRFLVGKRFTLELSGDGRLLLSANMRPATSVSVIDVTARKVLAEVSTPGCVLVLPHGPSSFSSLCANGSFMTVHLGPDGAAEKLRGEAFFNPDVDPVFDDWAYSRAAQRAFLVSYQGLVYPVDLSGSTPRIDKSPWPLTSAREKSRGWQPGGGQPFDYHAASDRLFVLMHRGGAWTQSDDGTEIWVFEAASRRRLQRIRLRLPATALAVTRDDAPLLFTSDGGGLLSTYRAVGASFRHIGDLKDLGTSSGRLTVAGK